MALLALQGVEVVALLAHALSVCFAVGCSCNARGVALTHKAVITRVALVQGAVTLRGTIVHRAVTQLLVGTELVNDHTLSLALRTRAYVGVHIIVAVGNGAVARDSRTSTTGPGTERRVGLQRLVRQASVALPYVGSIGMLGLAMFCGYEALIPHFSVSCVAGAAVPGRDARLGIAVVYWGVTQIVLLEVGIGACLASAYFSGAV